MTPQVFISKICHDVRAPLRALKEMPDWLENDLADLNIDLPEHITETTSMMKTQAVRLDSLISGLGAWARLVRTEERPETVSDDAIIKSDWPATLTIACQIPTVPLESEHAKLVIHHLVDNAFRHSGRTGPNVVLTIKQQEKYAQISVEDNGSGMSESDLKTIFEPLTTLKPRDQVEGSGMGLAIVSRIAELYHGSCRMIANPKNGVTALFEVPLPTSL